MLIDANSYGTGRLFTLFGSILFLMFAAGNAIAQDDADDEAVRGLSLAKDRQPDRRPTLAANQPDDVAQHARDTQSTAVDDDEWTGRVE